MSTITDTTPAGGVPEWTLGWRLQRALSYGKVSAQAMADHLDVSRSTVSRWMNEHGAPPKAAFLAQWAWLCKVDPAWLRFGVDPAAGPDAPGGQGIPASPCNADSAVVLNFRRHEPMSSAAGVAA